MKRLILIASLLSVSGIFFLFYFLKGEIICSDPYMIDNVPLFSCPMSRLQLALFLSEQDDYMDRLIENVPELVKLGRSGAELIVFDVGSNIGLFSYHFAKNFPGSKIYSFEPAPIYDVSVKNKNLHEDLMKNVEFHNIGFSNEKKVIGFHYYPNFAPTSSYKQRNYSVENELMDALIGSTLKDLGEYFYFSLSKIDDLFFGILKAPILDKIFKIWDYEVVEAKMSTIDDFMIEKELDRIDILKIDTEGAEVDILNGISDDHWEKIGCFMIETHTIVNEDGDTVSLSSDVDEILEKHEFVRVWDDSEVYNHNVLGFVVACNPRYSYW